MDDDFKINIEEAAFKVLAQFKKRYELDHKVVELFTEYLRQLGGHDDCKFHQKVEEWFDAKKKLSGLS